MEFFMFLMFLGLCGAIIFLLACLVENTCEIAEEIAKLRKSLEDDDDDGDKWKQAYENR